MYSIYDKPRLWFLGAFYIAAHKEIPHGAEWARKIIGSFDAPRSFDALAQTTSIYKRPLYHLIWKERVIVHPDPNINRIVTGAKLLANPVATRLMSSEVSCIFETVHFMAPALKKAPPECLEAIEALVRGITKQKDFHIAA